MKRGRKKFTDTQWFGQWKTRTEELACLYERLGTLDAVAAKVGLTRERVRQILAKGRRFGVCKYEPRKALCDRLSLLPNALKTATTLTELGKQLGYINGAGLRDFSRKFNLPYHTMRKQIRANYRRALIHKLHQHAIRLGTPALSTTILESDKAAVVAYNNWVRNYGGIRELRKELGIEVVYRRGWGDNSVHLRHPHKFTLLVERIKKFLTLN